VRILVSEDKQMKVMLNVSADQYTHIQVNGRFTDNEKRCFEWFSKWTVMGTSSRTGRLMLVDTE